MADTKSGYKRRFPKVGKCCCCFSPETSVIICSTILILCFSFGMYAYTGIMVGGMSGISNSLYVNSITTYIVLALCVCVVISVSLLVFGVDKSKLSFMRQYKIVFLIYLIYYFCSLVYTIYVMNSDDYLRETRKIIKSSISTTYLDDETLNATIKRSGMIAIGEYIITFLFLVYYYLSTCSYIEDVEERVFEVKDVRNLENNEYSF